jgi:hypothetical protein
VEPALRYGESIPVGQNWWNFQAGIGHGGRI